MNEKLQTQTHLSSGTLSHRRLVHNSLNNNEITIFVNIGQIVDIFTGFQAFIRTGRLRMMIEGFCLFFDSIQNLLGQRRGDLFKLIGLFLFMKNSDLVDMLVQLKIIEGTVETGLQECSIRPMHLSGVDKHQPTTRKRALLRTPCVETAS